MNSLFHYHIIFFAISLCKTHITVRAEPTTYLPIELCFLILLLGPIPAVNAAPIKSLKLFWTHIIDANLLEYEDQCHILWEGNENSELRPIWYCHYFVTPLISYKMHDLPPVVVTNEWDRRVAWGQSKRVPVSVARLTNRSYRLCIRRVSGKLPFVYRAYI